MRIKTRSTAIEAFALTKGGLKICFNSGHKYIYHDQNGEVFNRLLNAHIKGQSIGKTYHKYKYLLRLSQRL